MHVVLPLNEVVLEGQVIFCSRLALQPANVALTTWNELWMQGHIWCALDCCKCSSAISCMFMRFQLLNEVCSDTCAAEGCAVSFYGSLGLSFVLY